MHIVDKLKAGGSVFAHMIGGCAVALFSLAVLPGPVSATQRAGVAAGVIGDLRVSEGERPSPEAVKSGMDILLGDRVNSATASRMQVLLLDETVFTIGPDSDLVIDEFVYDPSTQAGRVTANFTKGVMRYVSGMVSRINPGGITIRTRDATIGVRGTALFIMDDPISADGTQFIGLLGPGDQNEAGLAPSRISVTSGGATVNVLRSGYGVFVSPGKALAAPTPIPSRLVKSLQTQLTGDMAEIQENNLKRPQKAKPKTKVEKTKVIVNRSRKERLGKAALLAAAALSGREGGLYRLRTIQSPRNSSIGERDVLLSVRQIDKIGRSASQQRIGRIERLLDGRDPADILDGLDPARIRDFLINRRSLR